MVIDIPTPDQNFNDPDHQFHLLKSIVDSTNHPTFVKDRSGRYLFCNAAGANAIGQSIEGVIGRTDIELLGAEAAKPIRKQDQRILESGEPETEFHILQTLDGAHTFEVAKSPYLDPDGNIIGVIGVARDVSKAKLAQELLVHQQYILERISRRTPLNLVLEDLVTLIEESLPQVLGSFLLLDNDNLRLRFAAGRNLPAAYNAAIDGVAIGPEVGSFGTAAFLGEPVYVADIATDPLWNNYRDIAIAHGLRACWSMPIRSRLAEGNRVLGTFAVYSRDVGLPDRKLEDLIERIEHLACIAIESSRNLQQLSASESRFRTFVENTSDAFFLHRFGGQIVDVNDQACKQLGYSRDELIGMLPTDFAVNFDPAQLASLMPRLEQKESIVIESVHRRKDGSEYPAEIRISPFTINDEKFAVSTSRDISRRKADEWALQKRLFKLTVLNEIGAICSKSVSIDEVLAESTRLISKELFPDNCGFFLFDSQSQTLTPHRSLVVTSPSVSPNPFSMQKGIVGRAARTGQIQRIADVHADRDYFPLDSDTQSELAMPLFVAGKLYAVLNVEQSKRDSFSEADERLMVAALDLIGGAIDRIDKQEQLREAHRQLATIFDTVADVIFMIKVDPDGGYQFQTANPAFIERTGLPLDAIVGQPLEKVIPESSVATVREKYSQAINERRKVTWEQSMNYPKGTVIGEVSITPLFDEHGVCVNLVGSVHDITQRKRSEAELRRTTDLLSAVTEGTIDAVYVKDLDGKYLMMNEAGVRAIGKPLSEIIGRDDSALFDPIEARKMMARDRQILTSGLTNTYEETISIHGVSSTYVSTKGPFRDHHDKIIGIIGISRDISKYKEAERMLRLSSFSIDRAVDSVFWISPDSTILHVNEAACRMLGYSRDEFVGKTVPEIDRNFAADAWPEHWEEIRRRGSFTFESRHSTKQGTILDTEITVNYLQYEGQEYNCAVMRDITDRKRAEAQLRESEERYRRLVNVLPSAVFIICDGAITFCNPSFVKLMGANNSSELIEKDPFQFIHPKHHSLVQSRIDEMKKTGFDAPEAEVQFVRLDGREVLGYFVATPLNDDPNPSILVALVDLTERERSMNLLYSIMQSVNDAIITTDDRGIVKLANPAMERLFGYTNHELIGTNVSRLMPEPYASEHDGYLKKYVRTGEAQIIGIGRELMGRRKDGSLFPLDLTVSEFRLESQRRFTGVIRDISERRRLEEQFYHAQKMEAVGQLAGGVAHDFNNLLTIINGYGDLLWSQPNLDEFSRESVAEILSAGQRAAQLTRQLLAFSRKSLVEPKLLDLNELITGTQRMLKRLVGEHIQFETKLETGIGHIKADRGQIDQVILNLVMNAADAMPKGGRLTIQTRSAVLTASDLRKHPELSPGRYVILTFEDSGCGMTEQVSNRIFEPFFTTKPVGSGTGLGLAVVHGIIQQSKAAIDVASIVGQGTKFTIRFPEMDVVGARRPQSSEQNLPRGTETILLVEDEESVRKMARFVLVSQGYNVLEAANGQAATELVAEYHDRIHALVTDVVMPGMCGRDLSDRIQMMRPEIRVLYTSGYTDDAVIRHGIERSMNNFLQKPFAPRELARKLREILDDTKS